MEIKFAAVSADNENQHFLHIKADKGETIKLGQKISIMLTDETFVEHEIEAMSVWQIKPGEERGKWIDVESISDGQSGEIEVYGIKGVVQTTSMPSPDERRRLAAMINVMPYKELKGGDESIYDYVDETFTVPAKVIAYLQTTHPHMVCMGLYKHPFKDMSLSGPYWYTDGEYYWDRDAWKYVVKYHVTLPQGFIDKVMSDEGDAFLEECAKEDDSWAKRIETLKERPNTLCFMPDDAGDYSLEDF